MQGDDDDIYTEKYNEWLLEDGNTGKPIKDFEKTPEGMQAINERFIRYMATRGYYVKVNSATCWKKLEVKTV